MRTFAIFASLMMLTVIAMPVVAAEDEYEYCDETQGPTTDITLYDLANSEIKIINGLPYIVVKVEDEYINTPLPLSDTIDIMLDGVPITIEVDGNYLLIPTEDGIERVCISEFDVELIDGEFMLIHEVNCIVIILGVAKLISLAKKGFAGWKAGQALNAGTIVNFVTAYLNLVIKGGLSFVGETVLIGIMRRAGASERDINMVKIMIAAKGLR